MTVGFRDQRMSYRSYGAVTTWNFSIALLLILRNSGFQLCCRLLLYYGSFFKTPLTASCTGFTWPHNAGFAAGSDLHE